MTGLLVCPPNNAVNGRTRRLGPSRARCSAFPEWADRHPMSLADEVCEWRADVLGLGGSAFA